MTKQNTPVRAVVDTNLIVSGLLKKPGVPYQIVEALRHGHFTLVLSPLLLTEYRQVLQRPVAPQSTVVMLPPPSQVGYLLLMVGHDVGECPRLA
jgi:hypothetical protein